MGTNFYLTSVVDESQERHLGKRSAAGLYCYGCDISLVTGMRGGLNARSPHYGEGTDYSSCPKCKAKPSGNLYNPELFTPRPDEITREEWYAVRYCYSFSFAQKRTQIDAYSPETDVVDEYGRHMTMEEFRTEVIAKAVFLFTHHIGQEFS